MTYADGYLRSGSSSYPGGRYTSSGRSCGSPSGLPRSRSLLSVLGVAACFSANPDGSVDLPFDPVTGVLRPDAWQRWLDWDPVRMVPAHADALRGLRAIWIDAGTRDDYHLDLGAQAFRAALRDIGVHDDLVHFELFDASHAAIDYRYPMSLAWLCGQMTK